MLLRLGTQWAGATTLRLGVQWVSTELTLVTAIDAGNADATGSEVLYGYSDNPEVWIEARPAAIEGTNGNGWRTMLFALDGAEGKTPLFKIDRSTRTAAGAPATTWLPLYTADFETWYQATSRTLVAGTPNYVEFQFNEPFPAGRIYVTTNPIKPQGYADDFAAELLTDYDTVAAPTASADTSGVFFTSPAEVDENARAIGGHPMYGIKLAWGGATTDGGPKRKLVKFAGVHAQGEHSSWMCFEAAVRWMLDDASQAAQDFRANWDVYLYFNLTPNGIYGGHRRHNFARTEDPNRSFRVTGTPPLVEIEELQLAVLADTGGTADALISWHGYSGATKLFIPGTGTDGVNQQTLDFIDIGKTVFGSGEYQEYFNSGTTYDFYWGYEALGCKVAFAAETQQSGNTSIATHELIGTNWAKTLQLADAAGVFYAPASVDPVAGNAVVTGHAPSISQPITVAPIAGAAGITGYAPSIEQTIDLAPVAGALDVTGYTPAIEQPITLSPISGDVVATGHAPTVEQGAAQTIQPVSGDVVVTGHTPTIEQDAGTYVHPQAGHVQATGHAPTIQQPITLSPIEGNATVAGYAPVIEQSLSVQPQSGQIVISGYVPGIEQGTAVTVSPQSGRIAITGYVPGVQVGVVEYSAARILSIAAENRRQSIAAENRRFAITPENRVNS